MKRRAVLATVAVLVSAGCLDGGDTSSEGGRDDNRSRTRTASNSPLMGTETDADGTVSSTTNTGTDTPESTVDTRIHPTTETTITATETAADEPPTSPIPIPDAPTDLRKDTPLTGEAHVAFEDDGSRVVVTGTIVGQNGCLTAVLESIRETNSGLVVTVATERNAPADETCSMALVDIEYRFVVRVEPAPMSVTVVHHGVIGKQTITIVKRGGGAFPALR